MEPAQATEAVSGLNDGAIAERIRLGAVNAVQMRSSRPYRDIISENVLTPFNIAFGVILVLLVALGKPSDAVFAGFSVFFNIVVGVLQEVKSKWELDRLALLSVQQATVRRNGEEVSIPLQQIVRDDVVLLRPGDRAPVDGPVLVSEAVEMDESLLTGESDPIPKQVADPILSGSFCLSGSCAFRAEKIGSESFAAQISRSSRVYKRVVTPLQQKINALVEVFILLLLVGLFLHVASSLNTGRSLVDTISFGTVLINNFVPVGLLVSISVSFALGAIEISRKRTLIQKINAVDSMNSVRILCTDKTGTLTQNRLRVVGEVPLGTTTADDLRELMALYGAHLTAPNSSAKAIATYAQTPRSRAVKTAEVPFNSQRKWGGITLDLGISVLVGSPDIILTEEAHRLQAIAHAQNGLRVLAVVTTEQPLDGELVSARCDRGLILLEDSLREDVAETIAHLRSLQVQVKVISGDHGATVAAIATAAGIANTPDTVFLQSQLDALSPRDFAQAALKGTIFGRIRPETKRALIAAMVRQGAYVAMVGDGVNDVPAFKEAKLAIAMNDGAQISKDVADIVLLDNTISTLPVAFAAGDRIKQKILASAKLYLTKNLATILAIAFTGFVQLPFLIKPPQATLHTLAVVGAPTLCLALGWFPPRRIKDFFRDVLGYSLLSGTIGALAITLGFVLTYFYALGVFDNDITSVSLDTLTREYGQAQAVATLIAMIYGLLIFFDSVGITIWKPHTVQRHLGAFIYGSTSVGLCVATLLLLPEIFQIEYPDRAGWTLVLFLPTAAHYLLRMLQSSSLLRTFQRSLMQP
jgi:cation-transporting ATPase E